MENRLKKIYIVYSVVFFVICMLPFVGVLFYQNHSNTEKRILATFPALFKEEKLNVGFIGELGEYFLDHFAFRSEMISANAVVEGRVFGTSSENAIIKGSNGWLYYKDSLDDYLGRNVMSAERVDHTVRTIELIQEYAQAYNMQFMFTVVPNKNSLYSYDMPYYYKKISDVNNLALVTEKLQERNVSYLDLLKEFSDKEDIFYHRLDSHWNNEGAVFALELLLDRLGKEYDAYENVSTHIEQNFNGDLYGMLYPTGYERDDNVIYEKNFTYEYTTPIRTTNDIKIETVNVGKQGSLVMFRDSFLDSMLPFIADEYNTGFFTREFPYPVKAIHEYNADTLIIEIVERHLGLLIQSIPLMGALEKDIVIEAETMEDGCQTMNVEEDEEFIKIYGTLDPYYIDEETPVYVRMVSDESTHIYEAFPIAEGISEEEILFDYGYGLYIDKEHLQEGSYEIEVLTQSGDTWYTSNFIEIYDY